MKSQSRFYLDLLSKVFLDSNPYKKVSFLERDLSYVKSRFENEGISFFTKVLPNLGKAIIRGIETSNFVPPTGFRRAKGSLLPAFMHGWTSRLFSVKGELLTVTDPYDLQEILQICMLFYKLELPYAKAQEALVIDTFVKTEDELPTTSEEVHVSCSVLGLARTLISGVFRGFDPSDIEPGHGPGCVATGEKGNGKYSFRRKYQRLHQEFPYYRYFSPSLSRNAFESGWYGKLLPELNAHAKVVLVPKDSRGPRLISMEPLEVQWIQQGLLRKLMPHIESHPLTRGKINFTSQVPNQHAALESSKTLLTATLDLKEASDRVSLVLVRSLFPEDIVRKFEACRSTATVLPNGDLLPLNKFAPMGSALCFPVMALTIWALCEAALRLKSLPTDSILVYGDDLVVPTDQVEFLVDVLHSAGLKVNTDKSYWKSHYRESCGIDAYNGVVVTPLRLRRPVTRTRHDPSYLLHLVQLSEALFNKGYWKSCQFLRDTVRKIYGNIPWRHGDSHLGYYCPSQKVADSRNDSMSFKTRINSDLQRKEILCYSVHSKKKQDYLVDPSSRLLKGLLGLYRMSSEDHHVVQPKACILRKRWCAA